MNPEIKAKWVAALRSGEYQKGADWLHNEALGTHCCLGVLQCVVPGLEKDEQAELLDPEALDYIGIDCVQQSHLANMNDAQNSDGTFTNSFVDIADYIEANL